ncbi:MAG: hypothetical protein JSS09_06015 [Verrucomicrobia bacterium]|nr:hypothetical protein [Verrucomicrobiota bacterium]
MTSFSRSISTNNFIDLHDQYQRTYNNYLESIKAATTESKVEKLAELLDNVEKNSTQLNELKNQLKDQATTYKKKHGSLRSIAKILHPDDPSGEQHFIRTIEIFLKIKNT